jgi:hypothetical protein
MPPWQYLDVKSVGTDYNLNGHRWILSMPDGIEAERLVLNGCSGLRSLPAGLKVTYLHMWGCPAWDGHILNDASGGVWVYTTGARGFGMPLEMWRMRHPNGDRG